MSEDEKLDEGGWDGDANYDRINDLLQSIEATVERANEKLPESDKIVPPWNEPHFFDWLHSKIMHGSLVIPTVQKIFNFEDPLFKILYYY